MKQITVVMVIAAMGLLWLTGCQKSGNTQIRRARLVANENIQLKKQLQDKDKQIEDLKKEIEEVQAKNAKEHEEFGNTTLKTLQMLADIENNNQALTLENEKLKEELEKLKSQ